MVVSGSPTPTTTHSRVVKDVLEATLRLQTASTTSERVAAAVDFLRLVTDGCRALVLTRYADDVVAASKGHPDFDAQAGAVYEHARKLALKSNDDGVTLVDPTARGMGYSLPVLVNGKACAAVYVASDNPQRRLDAVDLDAIRAATETIGVAMVGSKLQPAVAGAADPIAAFLSDPDGGVSGHSLRMAKHAFEKKLLRARLLECHGNIAAAARTLKMDRGQLSRLLKKHRVDKTVFRSAESTG